MSNVKAPKAAPTPPERVVQLAHESVKFPKLMPDGMPTLMLGSATNPSVAATPDDWLKLRLPLLLNPVPAEPVAVVLKVTVAALALATRMKRAATISGAAWTHCPIFVLIMLLFVLSIARSQGRVVYHIGELRGFVRGGTMTTYDQSQCPENRAIGGKSHRLGQLGVDLTAGGGKAHVANDGHNKSSLDSIRC